MEVKCENCGETFDKYPCHAKRCKHHFCSMGCYTEWQRGRPSYERTAEHRQRMSKIISSNEALMALQSRRMRKHNLTVKKGRTWEEIYGKVRAAELREHYSQTMQGENNPNYGNDALKGEVNPNWRGGKSFEPYPPEFNENLKETVRERDGRICQLCGRAEEENIAIYGAHLDIHHINYVKDDNRLVNLISLCKACHCQTNRGRRKYWQWLFSSYMAQRT